MITRDRIKPVSKFQAQFFFQPTNENDLFSFAQGEDKGLLDATEISAACGEKKTED